MIIARDSTGICWLGCLARKFQNRKGSAVNKNDERHLLAGSRNTKIVGEPTRRTSMSSISFNRWVTMSPECTPSLVRDEANAVLSGDDTWEGIYNLMMVLKFDGFGMTCIFTPGLGFSFVAP